MIYKKLDEHHYALRIDREEEVISSIKKFCEENDVYCGSLTGLGAAKYAKIGLFDTNSKKYFSKDLYGAMEITSLIGNISTKENEVYLHLHINLCDNDMNVRGGHLNECVIGATCEIIVETYSNVIDRLYDEEIGLNLFEF